MSDIVPLQVMFTAGSVTPV